MPDRLRISEKLSNQKNYETNENTIKKFSLCTYDYFINRGGGCQQDLKEHDLADTSSLIIENDYKILSPAELSLKNDLERIALSSFSEIGNKENLRIDFWKTIRNLTNNFEVEEIELDELDENFNLFNRPNKDLIAKHKLYMYFPYSENHGWDQDEYVTISWDPIDSEKEGIGYKINIYNPEFKDENKVTVNEEYAKNNPTIMILPDYINDPLPQTQAHLRQTSVSTFRIKEIRIGDENWRNSFFRSAYEFKAKYVAIRYNSPSPAGIVQSSTLKKISKKDARKKKWITINREVIGNWRPEELGYHFVIYHDGPGKTNFKFNTQFKSNTGDWLSSTAEVSFEVSAKDKHIVVDQIFDRAEMILRGSGGKTFPNSPMHNERQIHIHDKFELTYDWAEN